MAAGESTLSGIKQERKPCYSPYIRQNLRKIEIAAPVSE